MDLKIGCTGWSYEGWSGTFYPKFLKSIEWLKYYSTIFDITEINSTYYQTPNQFITKKWFSDTPEDFSFTAKFPGKITHEHKLKNIKGLVYEFLGSLVQLRSQILALVFQLPPSLSFDEARPHLDELFSYLPDYYRFPIEGRHASWFTDEAIDYLTEKNICLVWNDIPEVYNPTILTSDFVYVRLIGDRSIPDSEFGRVVRDRSDSIKAWAAKLKKIEGEASMALIMTNNHYQGFAPATANSLRLELGMSDLVWDEKKQTKLEF
ncbi:hypothetical protein MnTg01_00514 [archaeon MnTg01]|nr:hypothetical protein MnTg01_00514 [archaeon MnTg01]